MKTITTLMLIFFNSILSFSQVENLWQPDSVYKNKKVKKIFVYENSSKDLSEIVELDRNGKIIRVEKYSASYNKRTRKLKSINRVTTHIYDELDKVTQKIDTIIYHHNNSVSTERTYFYYENDLLTSSKYFKGDFEKPSSETTYSHNPFTSTTTIKVDTIITYRKTKEYEIPMTDK
jgi:vacuolar-type H+-ATPase subunit I/STV1